MRPALATAVLAATLAGAPLAMPAQADPVLGAGLTVWFGGGETRTGVGVRLFSNDEDKSFVGSAGVDYILHGGGVRPTLGIAYLQNNAYLGANLGLDLSGGPLRLGAGLGLASTR